jgi:HD-GYP domain-containing protein (c-di-GMP phosphodiesterase class II)
VIELHHENWDGTGYPHGLRAEQAPLAARIVKIADAYDAMTSDRPYRQGMQHEQALAVFETISGTQLDPKMVAVFRGIQPADLSGPAQSETESLRRLAAAVRSAAAQAIAPSPMEHP